MKTKTSLKAGPSTHPTVATAPRDPQTGLSLGKR
jgi:hypothetical protein